MEGTLGTEIAHGLKALLVQFDKRLLENLAWKAEVELAAALNPSPLLSALKVGQRASNGVSTVVLWMCEPHDLPNWKHLWGANTYVRSPAWDSGRKTLT